MPTEPRRPLIRCHPSLTNAFLKFDMANILLLEDEPDLREETASFLESEGHAVRQADRLAAVDEHVGHCDLAILDLMLPDGLGLNAIDRLRTANPEVGVIVLTALGTAQNKLSGFSAGADHYLIKPVSLEELTAVVDALCRRVAPRWRLNIARQCLISPDRSEMKLNHQEARLFEGLARHGGRTVSRRTLVEFMGHDWLNYDERRMDTLISRLRKRWREHAGTELPLRTEYRTGYSLDVSLAV